MSDQAIRVENLGKKYRIRHQQEVRRYKTFRDVLTGAPKRLWSKLPFATSTVNSNPTSEDFWALQDVSFEIRQGEAVGIIGRNGAGKSTLLKLLSRITEPTIGRIEIEGRIASLLEVGTGFHPELTGRENIYLNGAILGMARLEIRRKFDEIVAFAEVEKFLDTPVKRYSSGMYMRLAFAVAAHLEPEILIVDEVLSVGDMEFQKKCLGKMEDVSKGGRTVLFVSHNMDAIIRMCSRCILLSNGKVEADSDTKQAIAHYVTRKLLQDTVLDLRPAKRSWEPRLKAQFTSIQMVSANGLSGWSIPYGEQIGFQIQIEVQSSLSGLVVGTSIFTATGIEFTANSSSECLQPQNVAPGCYSYTIQFRNLRVIPGSYHALLWIRSEAAWEDFIYKAFEFDVESSELSSRHKTDTFNGILVPEIECRFEPNKSF